MPYLTLPYLTLPYLTLPYLTLPYLTLPYLTLPYLTLPYLTLPYLTLRYLTLPYVTLPYLTLPYLTLPYLTLPCLTLTLPCLVLPYLTLSCLALPCLALTCLVLPYLVLSCLALSCFTLPCLALVLPYLALLYLALPYLSTTHLTSPHFISPYLVSSHLTLSYDDLESGVTNNAEIFEEDIMIDPSRVEEIAQWAVGNGVAKRAAKSLNNRDYRWPNKIVKYRIETRGSCTYQAITSKIEWISQFLATSAASSITRGPHSYSCLQTIKVIDLKEIYCAEHEYMNMDLSMTTPLNGSPKINSRLSRKISLYSSNVQFVSLQTSCSKLFTWGTSGQIVSQCAYS